MKPEELTFLTSDYTTKLQSSRQYGTGKKKKKNRNINQEEDRNPGDKLTQLQAPSL